MIFGGKMKYSLFIDPEREEEIIIYAREKNSLVERIEEIIDRGEVDLVGYLQEEIVTLKPFAVECFFVEGGKLYAISGGKRYAMRERLYQLEAAVGDDFLKINQSAIVNVRAIEKFETSIGGSLRVRLKGGYTDYVSRRQLHAVKEKIGI